MTGSGAGIFRIDNKDVPAVMDLFGKIYTTPLALSWDGYSLPALNDGWYPINLGSRSGLIFRAARLGGTELNRQVQFLIKQESLTAEPYILLYGRVDATEQEDTEEPLPSATVLPESRLAVLRAPMFAILKGSSLVSGHSHWDALSLILPPISEDLGTPAYAHPLTKGWYRLGASHNTVCVNGDAPRAEETVTVSRLGEGIRAEMGSCEWKNLRHASRTLMPCGTLLHDHAEYETEEPMTFDWIFHGKGEFSHSGNATEDAVLEDGTWGGYSCFRRVRRICVEGEFTARWILGNTVLTMRTDASQAEIYTALSPDNPANQYRNCILLRIRGTSATFHVWFSEEML